MRLNYLIPALNELFGFGILLDNILAEVSFLICPTKSV
jgi:hypothetical protein